MCRRRSLFGSTPICTACSKAWLRRAGREIYTGELPYVRTFGDVPEGAPLLYLNSLMNVSFALNQGDFAKSHGVACGADWSVRVEKVAR